MTPTQLHLLKKQYLMKKLFASYFSEKERKELSELRKLINSLESQN